MSRSFLTLSIVHLLLLHAPTAHAACPATAADLATAVNASESAFSAMNIQTFGQARGEAIEMVDCLEEQLPPANVASLHRMQAFASFVAQDDSNTLARFRSALALQPGYRLPSSIAPEGSPLQILYQQAHQAEPSASLPVRPPNGTSLYVDGQLATAAPTERPFLLQVFASDGSVSWTGYLQPGDSLPESAVAATPPEPIPPQLESEPPIIAPTQAQPESQFPVGRTVAVGTSIATTAALGVLALRSYNSWQNILDECTTKEGGCSTGTLDNMEAERLQAVGLSIGAGVTGALSLGLGVSLAF